MVNKRSVFRRQVGRLKTAEDLLRTASTDVSQRIAQGFWEPPRKKQRRATMSDLRVVELVNPIQISLSQVSAKNTNPFNLKVIRVVSSVDCFINTGDSTVTASSTKHFLPAGVVEYLDVRNGYIAGIVTTGTGILYVSECS